MTHMLYECSSEICLDDITNPVLHILLRILIPSQHQQGKNGKGFHLLKALIWLNIKMNMDSPGLIISVKFIPLSQQKTEKSYH